MASNTLEKTQWESRDYEAQLLAGLLRFSRVSVLSGEAGAGKTTLLFSDVFPLLHRRATDWKLAADDRAKGVARFPERRRRDAGSPRAELAIFFRAWNDKPLTALRAQIRAALPLGNDEAPAARALADDLIVWSQAFDVRFLIILDEFEQYLRAPPDREGIEEFAQEFSQAVSRSRLHANFLIAVRDDAEPLLERFRTRIPGFDNSIFRLPARRRATPARPETMAPPPSDARAAIATPALASSANAELISTQQPESAAEIADAPDIADAPSAGDHGSAVAAYADASACATDLTSAAPHTPERLHGTPAHQASLPASPFTRYESYAVRFAQPRAAVTAKPENERLQPTPADLPVGEAAKDPVDARSADSNSPRVTKTHRLRWLALPLVIAPALLILWITVIHRGNEGSAERSAQAGEQERTARLIAGKSLPAAAALPRMGLAIDPDNATDMHVALDLRSVARDAGLDLVVLPGAVLFSKDSVPSLALMRYEFLQVLRTLKGPAAAAVDNLRVVMPLYTEEIYFITRRDSPLTFIHQLEGARINVGIESSSRRLTVARLYEAMFGTAVPVGNMSFLADDDALQKLVNDRTVDVVVVVAAQPAKSLTNLTGQISGSIKLLKLDPEHAASRRAIHVYLPAIVRAANYGRWLPEDITTLATMAFLVSTGGGDPEATGPLEMFARSLCVKLPLLRRDGHPKWREVQPGLELDAGWPYSTLAKTALQSCHGVQSSTSTSVVHR